MRKLQKRQVFICLLVSLLVWAHLFSVSPNISKLEAGKSFSYISSKELLVPDINSYLALLPPRQDNGGNILFARSTAQAISKGVPTRTTVNTRGALCSCQYEALTNSRENSFRIDSLNHGFQSIDREACQHLDIPPPPTSA